eukprot:1977968-Prymnesium_polylepis.1
MSGLRSRWMRRHVGMSQTSSSPRSAAPSQRAESEGTRRRPTAVKALAGGLSQPMSPKPAQKIISASAIAECAE